MRLLPFHEVVKVVRYLGPGDLRAGSAGRIECDRYGLRLRFTGGDFFANVVTDHFLGFARLQRHRGFSYAVGCGMRRMARCYLRSLVTVTLLKPSLIRPGICFCTSAWMRRTVASETGLDRPFCASRQVCRGVSSTQIDA